MTTAASSNLTRYLRQMLSTWEHDERSDAELLALFAHDKDDRAFATLVRRYSVLVWGVCYRILGHREEAEDAFQATFLVLTRKADQVRPKELVGHWLYGVAQRTAQDVRKTLARRCRHENQARTMQPTTYTDDVDRPDLLAVLDEEILQLPANYRLPLIFCRLENHTYAEAARSLGCSTAAVGRRVARAEELLRERLGRRGVALTGAGAAALLSQAATAKGMPVGVVGQTIQAVQSFCNEPLAPNLAASIAEGVAQSMGSGKAVLWGAVLFVTLAAGALGLVAQSAPKTPKEIPPTAASASPAAPIEELRQDCNGDPLPPGALARLGTMRLRHDANVRSLCFTPDGKELLTAGGDNLPRLWDAETGKLIREFSNIPKPQGIGNQYSGVSPAILSPDGRMIAVRSGPTHKLYLLETATGKRLHEFSCEPGHFANFAFSADGRAVIAQVDGHLESRDLVTGRTLWRTRELSQNQAQRQNVTLVISPDGKTLASSLIRDGVCLWDACTGDLLRELNTRCVMPHLAFSPDGRTIAVGGMGDKDSIHLWDVATGRDLRQLGAPPNNEPDKAYYYPVYSPDGKIVAARGQQGVCLWDAATGAELHRCNVPFNWCAVAVFSPDGKLLAALDDPLVRFLDVSSGKARSFRLPVGHEGEVNSLAFTPDGRSLISAAGDQTIRWWDATTGEQRRCLAGAEDPFRIQSSPNDHTMRRSCLSALSPDGTILAATDIAAPDEELPARELPRAVRVRIRLLDAATGKELRRLDGGNGRITSLTFSPDGKMLAEAFSSVSGTWLWDVASGKRVHKLTGISPVFTPDGGLVATRHGVGINGMTIRFWETATGKEVQAIRTAENILCLALSPDGSLLAAGSDRITLYSLSRDKTSLRLLGSRPIASALGFVTALAFSPDGRMLASSGKDHAICLWETASGKERAHFQGHSKTAVMPRMDVVAFTFAADGRRLASGGADSTILIWDATGRFQDDGLRPAKLTDREREELWDDLAGDDAARTARALWTLAADPKQGVPFVEKHLRAAAAEMHVALAGVPQLIRDLDDNAFPVRRMAQAELARLGEAAVPALRQALTKSSSAEMRDRLEQLLKEFDGYRAVPSGELLRGLRAVEILEQIGTTEARHVLKSIAADAPTESLLAQASRSALERLERMKRP